MHTEHSGLGFSSRTGILSGRAQGWAGHVAPLGLSFLEGGCDGPCPSRLVGPADLHDGGIVPGTGQAGELVLVDVSLLLIIERVYWLYVKGIGLQAPIIVSGFPAGGSCRTFQSAPRVLLILLPVVSIVSEE